MFQLIVVATLLICARGQDQPDSSTSTTTAAPTTVSPPPEICVGQNEIYLPQGVAPNCDTVCSEIGKPCTKQFIQPPSGCYCLPNHARNASNVCVPINECKIMCHSLASHVFNLPNLAMATLVSELLKPKQPHKPLLSSLESSPLEPSLSKPSLLESLHLNSLPKLPLPESSPLEPSLSKPSLLDHLHLNSAQHLLPSELPLSLPHPHLLPPPPPSDCQNSPRSMAAISSMSSVSSMSSFPELESHGSGPLLPQISHISLSHPPHLQGVFSNQYYFHPSTSFAADY